MRKRDRPIVKPAVKGAFISAVSGFVTALVFIASIGGLAYLESFAVYVVALTMLAAALGFFFHAKKPFLLAVIGCVCTFICCFLLAVNAISNI